MKKALAALALTAFVALPSFATYIVVLKDGTRYVAKSKWTVIKGKAIINLENGQSMQVDPSLIDVPRSEQMTKIGMANANVIDLNTNDAPATTSTRAQQPSLGSQFRLRKLPAEGQPAETTPAKETPATTAPTTPRSGTMPQEVLDKFELAMENVGVFDRKITPTGANSIRAELSVDTEDRVFNVISATSFLMVRNANVPGVRIDLVELYMKTSLGGAAGRFQMSRADAEAINNQTISQQEYFVRKVIY
jgi:hypothetical protein